MLAVAIVLTYFLFAKPGLKIDKIMKGYLAFAFTWAGLMFPIHGFSKVFFAIYYLVLVSLFIIDIFIAKIEFKLPKVNSKKYFILFLIISAFVLYPLIEYISGHSYPRILLFGVAPCPTIIFSLALLIGSIPKVDKKIFILLIIPAISYGFIVPITLRVWADFLLLVSGMYGLIILIKNWKLIEK
jgi:hypothetical protein